MEDEDLDIDDMDLELDDDESPDQDEGGEPEDRWAWAKDYDPDQVKNTFENISAMQAEAHRRNEEAARERADAQRMLEMVQNQQQNRNYGNPPPQLYDDDDEYLDDGVKRRFSALEQILAKKSQEFDQRINEMQYQSAMTQAQRQALDVLRSSEHGKELIDFHGEDEAVRRYVQRAFDPSSQIRQDQLADKVREWSQQDASILGAKKQKIIKDYIASKTRSKQGNIPSGNGPKKPNRARPASAGKGRLDWTKPVTEEQELAALEAVMREFSDG